MDRQVSQASPSSAFPAASRAVPVRLFRSVEDSSLYFLSVVTPNLRRLLSKLHELLTSHGVEFSLVLIVSENGIASCRFELQVGPPFEFADVTEWGHELEEYLVGESAEHSTSEDIPDGMDRHLSVNLDLLSFNKFEEVAVHDGPPEELRYRLELAGILQSGLVTYVFLMFFRSGMSVLRADISLGEHITGSFELSTCSPDAETLLRTYLDIPTLFTHGGNVPLPFHVTRSDNDFGALMDQWGPGLARRRTGVAASRAWLEQAIEEEEEEANARAGEQEAEPYASEMPSMRPDASSGDLRSCIVSGSDPSSSQRGPAAEGEGGLQTYQSGFQLSLAAPCKAVTVQLPSGDEYSGSCAYGADGKERRQGYGRYKYASYEHSQYKGHHGQWRDDKKHGYGVMFYQNGGVYVGQWENNRQHGLGVLLDYGGKYEDVMSMPSFRYEGKWVDGQPHGFGVQQRGSTSYFGHFVNGQKRGRGLQSRISSAGLSSCEAFSAGGVAAPLMEALEAEMSNMASSQDRFIRPLPVHPATGTGTLAQSASFALHRSATSTIQGGRQPSTAKVSSRPRSASLDTKKKKAAALLETRSKGSSDSLTSLSTAAQTTDDVGNKASRSPMLWGREEIAAFLAVLGLDADKCAKVRNRNLKSVAHLLDMTNSELRREVGLSCPVERLMVRQSLQRVLDADRQEHGIGDKKVREILADSTLARFIIHSNELEITDRISEGGYGTVFTGMFQPSADRSDAFHRPRRVAVKEMMGERRVQLYELLKEAHIMASLHHPNICQFIGVCKDGTAPVRNHCILSELMDCSLSDLIHDPDKTPWWFQFSNKRTASLSKGICSGLAYMHKQSLVHADLKSANVLIDYSSSKDLVPRICDFGHAVVRTFYAPHHRCCTPNWAAPEALRSEAVGPAADVYSFGVVLWEVLTQQKPHADLSYAQVLAAVGWTGWTPDLKLLPEVPPQVHRLLKSCLSFTPVERPSAKEARSVFTKILRQARHQATQQLLNFLGTPGSMPGA